MKQKRILSILLAAIMVMSAAVCGASAEAADASQPAYVQLAGDTSDVDRQLNLFYAQRDQLEQVNGEQTWYYTVADLDHDGTLEFIAASLHPQDRSTNLKVWGANADRSALTEYTLQKDPDESFPDIMTDTADTFHDPETDTWYYLVYDNIIISDTEVYTVKTAVNLKNSVIAYDAYAVEHSVKAGNRRTVDHTDPNGVKISPEQYNASVFNTFASAERSSTNFDWFTVSEVESLARLADSYAVFMGQKAPTEIFPVPKPAALNAEVENPSAAATQTPVAAPQYLLITKNPTNENRKAGETALFVSLPNAYESLTWTLVAPNGGAYSVQNFRNIFGWANVTGEYSTTLSIANVSEDMNGWGAYCTFYYLGQTARTSTAYIYVQAEKKTPVKPTPEQYGVDFGTVTDYTYSSVTISITGRTGVVVPMSICDITGEIYLGATAQVHYTGKSAMEGKVTYVYIEGEQHVVPDYGSMSGTCYNEGGGVTVFLDYGGSVYVGAWAVNVYGGTFDDIGYAGGGSRCTVYYIGEPTAENIYQVDVYVTHVEPEKEEDEDGYNDPDYWDDTPEDEDQYVDPEDPVYDGGYDDGSYDGGGYDDGGWDEGGYDDGGYDDGSYDEGVYDDGGWAGSGYEDSWDDAEGENG